MWCISRAIRTWPWERNFCIDEKQEASLKVINQISICPVALLQRKQSYCCFWTDFTIFGFNWLHQHYMVSNKYLEHFESLNLKVTIIFEYPVTRWLLQSMYSQFCKIEETAVNHKFNSLQVTLSHSSSARAHRCCCLTTWDQTFIVQH